MGSNLSELEARDGRTGSASDMNTLSFLCVHPNMELYGSDRTFLQSVRALKERWPTAKITVLIVGKGPLYHELRKIVDDVRVESIFVLRRSELGLRLLWRLPSLLVRIYRARRLMAGYTTTYINTVVVIDFILASRFRKKQVIIHVHEIPTGLARSLFSSLLWFANSVLIYISAATRDAYIGLHEKQGFIVWNGTSAKSNIPLVTSQASLKLLLIGRFNAWKGQPLLLDALAKLDMEERARVHVRLVGSVYEGQEHFKAAIESKIASLDIGEIVEVLPFDPDPNAYYAWADVVIVPSIEPEPFGLVAIEAMAAGRAVIAAGHGGLAEIVVDRRTGTLFEPANVYALRDAIRRYLAAPELARLEGERARSRFDKEFDEAIYMQGIADVVQEVILQ